MRDARVASLLLVALVLPAACDPSEEARVASVPGADAAVAPADGTEPPRPPRVALPTVLAAGLAEPRGLVAIGETIFVAEHGAGRIVAVPRSGAAPPRVVASGLKGPYRLATDGTAIVATEREGGNVLWIDVDGSLRLVASDGARPGEVGVRDGEALWLEEGDDAGTGALRAAGLDGGAPRTLAGGITRAHGLAVQASHVCFTADAVEESKGSVFCAASDAGVTRIAATPEQARGVAIDEDAGLVYWAARKNTSVGGSEGFIRRARLDGADAAAADALTDAPYGADRIVVRGGRVYFSNYQTVVRVSADGGPREDVALHTSIFDLVVTDDGAYWTDPEAGKLYVLRAR